MAGKIVVFFQNRFNHPVTYMSAFMNGQDLEDHVISGYYSGRSIHGRVSQVIQERVTRHYVESYAPTPLTYFIAEGDHGLVTTQSLSTMVVA